MHRVCATQPAGDERSIAPDRRKAIVRAALPKTFIAERLRNP